MFALTFVTLSLDGHYDKNLSLLKQLKSYITVVVFSTLADEMRRGLNSGYIINFTT